MTYTKRFFEIVDFSDEAGCVILEAVLQVAH